MTSGRASESSHLREQPRILDGLRLLYNDQTTPFLRFHPNHAPWHGVPARCTRVSLLSLWGRKKREHDARERMLQLAAHADNGGVYVNARRRGDALFVHWWRDSFQRLELRLQLLLRLVNLDDVGVCIQGLFEVLGLGFHLFREPGGLINYL
jgi:hypothetical protein